MDVYGDALPADKDLYQATEKSPVPMRIIIKEFGSYKKFLTTYKLERVKQRNLEKPVVTKQPAKGGKRELK